jgi:hypothetical protein
MIFFQFAPLTPLSGSPLTRAKRPYFALLTLPDPAVFTELTVPDPE